MKLGEIMKSKYMILFAVSFIAMCILISSFSVSNAQPFIGEDDRYTKEVDINSQGSFFWTVYKNSSLEYSVTVNIENLNDWDKTVTPSNFVLSKDESYQIVTLDFKVPKYPKTDNIKGKIDFEYRVLNSSEKNTITKDFNIDIVGVYEGKENTIFGGFTNPLPYPLNNAYGALILNFLIWLIFSFIIYFIIKYVIVGLAKKTKTEFDDSVVEIIRKPIFLIIILYGIIISIIRFGINVGYQASLYQIYFLIVVIIAIYIFYRVFNELLDEITKKRGGDKSNFGSVLKPVLKKVGAVVIVIGGLIFGLSAIGIEITALLAGAGVMGLVLAFAAQDTLSNYFSGMHLLLDRPFKIGDIIILDSGEYCQVLNVGMRSTKLYSLFEHESIVLPNNTIANQKIVNIVQPDKKIRKQINVSVAYGSDLGTVYKILHEVTSSHPDVIDKEGFEVFVRFAEFGDSGLKFLIIFWVDDVMNQWKVMSDIRTEIDKRFREEGITVPFPQRTVWIKEHKQNNKKEK